MKVTPAPLPGVLQIEPKIHGDDRGHFVETWVRERYAELGVGPDFVQDNLSYSRRNVLRGLHLQHPRGQGKLVYALTGEVFDVAVDVRVGSPTFGQSFGCTLSAAKKNQLWIPPGFAHGFCVTSDEAIFVYKCTDRYDPASEVGLLWNDPELSIVWPVASPIVSPKDAVLPTLAALDRARLPRFE